MKFTTVAFVAAFLCVAAVSAAPSSPAVDVSGPLDIIKEKIKEFLEKVKCARDVTEQAIQGSELKSEFEQFKATLDQLTAETKQCPSNPDKLEALKCIITVVQKLQKEVEAFTQKVADTSKELADNIRKQIETQCLKKPELIEFAEETFAMSAAEQFQCSADYLGEISKANGLGELWARTQPQLQLHIDSWKKCAEAGNKFLVALCNVKEGFQTFRVMTEYMGLAAGENPKAIMEFARGLQSKCSASAADEIQLLSVFDEEDTELPPFLAKIKCQSRAIDVACRGTKYQPIFDAHRDAMFAMLDGMEACKAESTGLKSKLCIAKELRTGLPTLVPFFRDLAKMYRELPDNQELLEKIKAETSKCNV